MRIIGGSARGRKLTPPKGKSVRPTADRVKESIFNIVGDRIEGAAVLDLFCGSGAIGIEALSRGAEHVTFVDNSPASVKLTRDNLALAGFSASATVSGSNVKTWLQHHSLPEYRFSLIFLDPPYTIERHKLQDILELIAAGTYLEPGSLVILEQTSREQPVTAQGLERIDARKYGDTTVVLYEPEMNIATEESS